MSQLGYDIFFEKPNSNKSHTCNVCGTATTVEVAVKSHNSMIHALSKPPEEFDIHRCTYTNEEWHNTAYKLIKAIEETPSKTIAEIMRKDLLEILEQHTAPKK